MMEVFWFFNSNINSYLLHSWNLINRHLLKCCAQFIGFQNQNLIPKWTRELNRIMDKRTQERERKRKNMKNDFGLNNINHTQNQCCVALCIATTIVQNEWEKAVQFPVSKISRLSSHTHTYMNAHYCNHKPHMVWHKVSRSDIFQYFGISFVCFG